MANTIRWVNQGPQIAAPPAWIASKAYALHNAIIAGIGNLRVVIIARTSKAGTRPTWNTTVCGARADRRVRWRNGGSPATVRSAAGGTSGIIFDNTVVTVGGASQVYFSTQGNQACATVGTGGCVVQASQSALN